MKKKTIQSAIAVLMACCAIVTIILWDYIFPDRIPGTPHVGGGWQMTVEMIGKTEEEANLPKGCIENTGTYKSGGFETEIFDADAKVYVYFSFDQPKVIREVFITTHKLSYTECVESLKSMYGEPCVENIRENPSDPSGHEMWTQFDTGDKEIEVSQGSGAAYLTILIYQK